MKKYYLLLLLLIQSNISTYAQDTEVLTLGSFHFAFYNRDIVKIDEGNQIDVLLPEHQVEIEQLVGKISAFNPSIIAIEVDPVKQQEIDSLYREYLNGRYEIGRDEYEQIGFRIAKQFGLEKLHCVNDWGHLPEEIQQVIDGNDSLAKQSFLNYFYNNPDSLKMYNREYVFKTKGIIDEFREANNEENIKKDLGNYLLSVFKYETDENEFFGVDFTTGWWFNRNLRIFRNIQKIPTKPDDRILVIYGSGHMNLLNILFDASSEYRLVKTNDYLK